MRLFLSERQVHSGLSLISPGQPPTLPQATVPSRLLGQYALSTVARNGRAYCGGSLRTLRDDNSHGVGNCAHVPGGNVTAAEPKRHAHLCGHGIEIAARGNDNCLPLTTNPPANRLNLDSRCAAKTPDAPATDPKSTVCLTVDLQKFPLADQRELARDARRPASRCFTSALPASSSSRVLFGTDQFI
jgi:hypothetical protein